MSLPCLAACAILGFLASASAASSPSANPFSYKSTPAGIDERRYGPTRSIDGIAIKDISFRSPMSGRVPAYLLIPSGRGRHPGIVFAHWALGDRAEFLPEAIQLARLGFASILPDAPFARPAPWTRPPFGNITNPKLDAEEVVESVLDLRRALDVLLAVQSVDRSRVAFVGHSFNAGIGGRLLGVDHRFSTAILVGGSGKDSDLSPGFSAGALFSQEGIAQLHSSFKPNILKRYSVVLAPLDADNFISRADIPIFMQFAEEDAYTSRVQALDYFSHASGPKVIRWYIGGHELDGDSARADRLNWLKRYLLTRR